MDIGVVSTNKPWTMLVFALVAINGIVALGAVAGMETPLDQLANQPDMLLPDMPEANTEPVAGQYTPQSGTAVISGAAILLLALNCLILYGLAKGHVWSWWLLTFISIATMVGAVIGMVSGAGIMLLPFIVNVVMLAALLKKEVVQTYKPQLEILPQDGVW